MRVLAEALGIHGLGGLASPQLGKPVRTARSSWVRCVQEGSTSYFIKTYDYPTWAARARGALRNTFLSRSRALREWDALQWLRTRSFPAPRPVGVLEARRLGFLHSATLVTEAWPGEPLDQLLARLDEGDRAAVADALAVLVLRLHAAGFRDRNLDLRNLLARPVASGWEVAKIDSPRHRLVAPGAGADRWTRRDWQRLLPQVRALVPDWSP